MSLALVLVVFVSSADADSPATAALAHAAEEVLGRESRVTIQSYDVPLDDAQLAAAAPNADLIAEVSWQDGAHRHATVHCYVGKLHRFVNREVAFDDDDDLRERGRMIGFSVASMAPEVERLPPAPAPVKVPPKPSPDAVRGDTEIEPESRPASRAAPSATGTVDVTALGATGFGGPAGGVGVSIAGRWLFLPAFSLRLGAGVRRGDVPVADSVSELAFGALGLGFQFSSTSPTAPFSLGGRTDLLLLSHELRHSSSDDAAPQHQSRVMGGADVLLEGTWYFWKGAGLLINVGGEFAFGHTDVFVHGKEVADIPALRGVGELGIRARF